MKHKKLFRGVNILLLISYFMLLTSLASCGRRGDPVLVEPRQEKAIEKKKSEGLKDGQKQETLKEQKKSEHQTIQVTAPGPPAGLTGIYTQTSIVLTWDEVAGQKIKYRVYRSSGDGYILAGETVTPAFTDKNVQPNTKYYYKVGAVGATEGPLSKEIQIKTEVH